MEKFKKRLLGLGGRSAANAIVVFAIAIALAVCGFLLNSSEEYVPFNPLNDGFASMDVRYVMGPFAEETDGTRTSKEFFIAETADQMWYVLGVKPNTELPIYGENISDADIAGLAAQTVYGKNEQIQEELASYLVDFFNETDFGITSANYAEFFGTHYLDASVTASHEWDGFYYLAVIIALFGLIPFFTDHKRRQQVKRQVNELEANGQLKDIYEDFTSGDPIYSSRLKLAISHHYLLDFAAAEGGFKIIRLSEIDKVFLCNMIAGQPTTTNYIALENEQQRYCVAKWPDKSKQFKLILERLKADVEKENILQ